MLKTNEIKINKHNIITTRPQTAIPKKLIKNDIVSKRVRLPPQQQCLVNILILESKGEICRFPIEGTGNHL